MNYSYVLLQETLKQNKRNYVTIKKKKNLSFNVIVYFPLGLDLCIKDTGYNDISTELMNRDPVMTNRRIFTGMPQASLASLGETDK